MTRYFLAFLFFVNLPSLARTTLPDSVGIERKDGVRYVLHRVDEGQTLFALSRKYRVSVAAIQQANPGLTDGVQYGQMVRIPRPEPVKPSTTAVATSKPAPKKPSGTSVSGKTAPSPNAPANQAATSVSAKGSASAATSAEGIHVVDEQQTLFSISHQYNVLMRDIRRWNGLTDNNIRIGQALVVSEKAYQMRQPSSPVPDSPATTGKPEKPAEKPIAKTPKPTTPTTDAPTGVAKVEKPAKSGRAVGPLPTKGVKISEMGFADIIPGDANDGKLVALHRSVPVGTLVEVRNDVTQQRLFVKVIGKLPNTAVNNRVVARLSAGAFTKLSGNGRRFRAETSYVAPAAKNR